MTAAVATLRRVGGEVAKIPAFLRRDLLTEWSYRTAFVGDVLGLATQAVMFYFVGLMVDPAKLPEFGGSTTTYLEFVAIGIAMFMFVQVCLTSVAGALREEQYMGTLESLMLTPTSALTVQIGSMAYELVYVPIRTAVFLIAIAVAFGVSFDMAGIPPAMLVMLAFVPFVWGLGILAGAATLTLKRGEGVVGLIAAVLTISSGAYFPIDLLPGWLQTLAEINPFTIALDAMRDTALGGAGWGEAWSAVLTLLPLAAASLAVGYACYTWALRRQLRRGTLGEY